MGMLGLYKILVILFGLLFIPVSSKSPCYDEEELQEKAERKLTTHYHQPYRPAHVHQPDTPAPCPVELYRHAADISSRSLSPWRYIYETKEDRFPRTLAVAQCLCKGCIISREKSPRAESMDYNSVPLKQSRVVLRKELCEDGKKYRLVPVSEDVAIGCTCVRAKILS
ncbi:interleukin-17C [Lampris incognitus]|uniref:interleukin-17C n=1 Tax=Lampris incognitus TaxID=2546036 RepID=UPI0024B5685C|nr:interleukin-17C [Lampris incognitus]